MISDHKKVLDEIGAGKNECGVEVTRLNGEVTFQERLPVYHGARRRHHLGAHASFRLGMLCTPTGRQMVYSRETSLG